VEGNNWLSFMFSPCNSIDFYPLEDFQNKNKNTQIKHFSYQKETIELLIEASYFASLQQ